MYSMDTNRSSKSPRWALAILFGIAALAATLYSWNLSHREFHGYYAMAIRSMTESWRAFIFGALDPASFVTVDKLPGFLWPEAISTRIFGFHPWAIVLPQVIAGVVTTLVLYKVVNQWSGPVAGLLAAGIFAFTPITAAAFGHAVTEDPMMTMFLVLAADGYQRAANTARLRPLLLSGVWVGVAFHAKMLQAWAVLPALGRAYLIVAPAPMKARLRHLATAGVVVVVVSAFWMALVTLTPKSQRPYVDSTTNDSAVAMVIGYNGLTRFGVHIDGALTPDPPPPDEARGGPSTGAPRAPSFAAGTTKGWGKLFNGYLGTQAGWLYPLAALALIAGLVRLRRAGRTDVERGGYIMWGTWLVVIAVAFSAGEVAHAAYMAALAPPLAALSGAGLVAFWRAYRSGGPPAWLLPAAIALTAGWTAYLTGKFPTFLPWLVWVMVALAGVALLILAFGVLARRTATVPGRVGLVIGLAALLIVPTTYALSTMDRKYGGNIVEVAAGPAGRPSNGPFAGPTGTLTPPQQQMMDYLSANRSGATYLFATDSWTIASPYVIATGAKIMPMGGFTADAPTPTLAEFQRLVAGGKVRHALLAPNGFTIWVLRGGRPGTTPVTAVTNWIRATCDLVPLASPGGAAGTAATAGAPTGTAAAAAIGTGQLYDCAP